MRNLRVMVTLLIGILFVATSAYAGGAPAAKGGRIERGGATTAAATPKTADPAPATPATPATASGSVSFGEHGWGCVNGLIVVNKETLAKAFGHAIAPGSTCLVYNNQKGFPNSGKHAPEAQCDECRAHGSRFGEGGGFCRYVMSDNGNTFTFEVTSDDFATVNTGDEVRWAFQLYGPGQTNAEYWPTPSQRKEGRVYADPNASNGQSFRGALSRNSTTAAK